MGRHDVVKEDLGLALLRAIAKGDREGVVSLLARGADVNGDAKNGPTPLDMTVIADRPELARLLVLLGADVNAKRENAWTALHLGAFEGRRKMMAVLTELGADANAVNAEGLTPSDIARLSDLPVVTRREVLLTLICGAGAGTLASESLSPRTFPWAVDRQAHLARRRVFSQSTEPSGCRGVLLHRLHLALENYWRAPDSRIALIQVRHRLIALKLATQTPGTPADWREVHDFAAILLKATEWRRCV